MIRIGPLVSTSYFNFNENNVNLFSLQKWTNLNPSAPPFEPKNREEQTIEQTVGPIDSKATNSCGDGVQQISSSTSSRNVKKKGKPSALTLERLITEKLRIESNPKKESKNTNEKNQKKSRKEGTTSMAPNLLDSSAPTRKRGKEREIPKPKKPTTLKKIIINEKNDKKEFSPQQLSLEELNKTLIHNKKYREYCGQRLTEEVDKSVISLLTDLVSFQDRMYLRDPLKAKIRKRLCFGFNEVTKYAKLNKIKLLVIAPDVEKIESRGGLDDYLSTLINICQENQIPIVFALNRRRLGIVCKKKGSVSCVAILNCDGTQENLKQLMSLCESERNEYKSISEQSFNELKALSEQEIQEIIDGLPHIPNKFSQFSKALNPSERRVVKLKKNV